MKLKRLKALDVTRANLAPGMYADGGSLYLRVARGGSRQWIFRYKLAGKLVDLGLGGITSVTLADARLRAAECRKQLAEKKDPLTEKRAVQAAKAIADANEIIFSAAAKRCIETRKSGWRNAKHAAQWLSTLETYVFPVMGNVSVGLINVHHVLRALEPIWVNKTETASRVRQRIEAVLDWAGAMHYRQGENPARWKGNLAEILSKPSKVKRVEHHRTIHYGKVAEFVAKLRERQGMAAAALEFQILTAGRSGEVRTATWEEIDLQAKTWTVPHHKIKAGRTHRVPLSPRALAIVEGLPHRKGIVFPGIKLDRPLNPNAMLTLLDRMELRHVVVPHGFRSAFRDWSAEIAHYPREVAEAALAHAVGDATEAAYLRSDLFDRRRRMMNEWAIFCEPRAEDNVVPMKRQGEKV